MTRTPQSDWSGTWLAALRHLKNYEKKATLGDYQTAAESAAQVQLLAAELIAYCDAKLMPGTWETD
jgi:hypothetical protein